MRIGVMMVVMVMMMVVLGMFVMRAPMGRMR